VKIGKLNPEELQRLVFDRLPAPAAAVASGPSTGVDCAAVRFGDGQVILTTDPITGAAEDIGRLAVHVSCNDIACCGIRPSALLMVLLAPPEAEPEDIARVVDQAAAAAQKLSVSIIGGHTEISDAVTRFVIITTAIGFTYGRQTIQASGGQPGDTLVMTKTAALEGTAIMAADQAARLAGSLSPAELQAARDLIEQISVVEDGSCGASQGAHAMHDATEGGILGACWELAEASGTGCTIDLAAIPLHPLTEKICARLELDPYRLIASGSMLIATPDPAALIGELSRKGIRGTIIGTLTENREKQVVFNGKTANLQSPQSDELYKTTGFAKID
jgi:hydrogenase expression/formation protein HypE